MFFTSKNHPLKTKPGRAIAAGFDIAVDFATLGEYRVVTDAVPAEVSHQPRLSIVESSTDGMWASEIEWSAAPERTRSACSLPRARNRAWARSRIGV